MRKVKGLLLLLVVGLTVPCCSQEAPNLETYFRRYVGLNAEQIEALHSGQAVSKTLHSRKPAEIFVFGAVYVNAAPDAYIALANDFDRLRTVPGYLALGRFGTPPQLSDLRGFTFDSDDIESLKKCKPGDCDFQLPEGPMRNIQDAIDWTAPNAADQLNQLLQNMALGRFLAYQQEGNAALGVYNDKEHPTDVPNQFAYILSYLSILPERFPDFYQYLLSYPGEKPANVQDLFYWEKVKFGLKPTLRVLHVVTRSNNTPHGREYVVAEKQLYASHYFQTALDLTFCIPEPLGERRGFYLIKVMGSEQAGLTGLKGSIVRKAAVGRSASSLQKSLAVIKAELESGS
jgi:hypothetical protein